MADIQDLIHLEQNFFDEGYKDGYAHGRIHGLIEGRALGREKGYEIWEEIGFYEGFALVLKEAYDQSQLNGEKPSRTFAMSSTSLSHTRHLLQLISQFPNVNPKSNPALDHNSDSTAPSQPSDSVSAPESEVDVSALLNNIRARYKALCASLGVRPRVTGSLGMEGNTEADRESYLGEQPQIPKRTKRPIWKIEVGESVDEETHPNPGEKVTSLSKLDEMSF